MKFLRNMSILLCITAVFSDCSHNIELCSYSSEDGTCTEPLVCQTFNSGLCTRHDNCDESGLCYAELSFINDKYAKVSAKNYFVEGCPAESFGFEAVLDVGICEKVLVFNQTYHARVDLVSSASVFYTTVFSILYIFTFTISILI